VIEIVFRLCLSGHGDFSGLLVTHGDDGPVSVIGPNSFGRQCHRSNEFDPCVSLDVLISYQYIR